MEALVGSALLSSTAGASTVGLIGAGGVLAPAAGSIATAFGGSLLSGLLTGASAFAQMQAGNMQAEVLKMQAQQSDLSARNEILRGRQQSIAIREQLDRDLASASATFAARGALAGEGSSAAAIEQSKKNASEDIQMAQFGATMASAAESGNAAISRKQAAGARTAGYVKGATTLLGAL